MINDKKPLVIYKSKFTLGLNNPDRKVKISDISSRNKIGGIFNYFSNIKKRAINMFDYYEGKINKDKRVNIILENGEYATEEDVSKLKKDYLKYFNNSNLYEGIISFDNDYIDEMINLKDLEKLITKEVLPKFFKNIGYKDVKNMAYIAALHANTDNYHFHIAFIEKKPNFINANGEITYRRKGKLSQNEIIFIKNETIHSIKRHKEFTPLVIMTNKEIDDLKKYFKPGEKNYILKNYDDLILEENILRLGELLYKKRKDKKEKIKFNSIYDKEITSLTKNIKNYLFKNKKSELYQKDNEFKQSIKMINNYFYNINKENNNKRRKFNSEYAISKQEYIDNYIYNAIVNHSYFKYSKIKENRNYLNENDIIKEIILKKYKRNKKQTKKDILINYLKNNNEKLKYKNINQIEESIKNINAEMEEAIEEFSKLFQNDYSK